jgi:hypothetical protein
VSKYNLSWRDLRSFNLATRQSEYDVVRNAMLVIGLVALYGIVCTIDYHVEQRIAAERQLEYESAYAQVLRDCMSGASGFYFPDSKKAYECRVLPL